MAIGEQRSKYKAIFFDLDHTLWDFDTNSKLTLTNLFEKYVSPISTAKPDQFIRLFKKINDDLWDAYNKGRIDMDVIRDSRFVEIFRLLEIDNELLARQVSAEYLFTCPRQPNLIPNTIQILDYLAPHYKLHILTNGFEDVQSIKLEKSGISSYFHTVITSESAGHKKPSLEFFEHALSHTGIEAHETVMIGDNLKTDIAGANKAFIDTVYFNPGNNVRPHKANYVIKNLMDLTKIL